MTASNQAITTWRTIRLRFLLRRTSTPEQKQKLAEARRVTFLPMEAIGEKGELDLSITKDIEEVSNGYTHFFDGDVLVAKITPCFENGKGAVVRGTLNGVGFGTTELHVLNPTDEVDARFLYYLTASSHFRQHGEGEMTGAAGQKRVPEAFIKNYLVSLPVLEEQRAIAELLDRETAQLDKLLIEKERLLKLLAEKRRALITRIVTRGLNPNANLHDTGLTWLGRIPTHWRTIRLKFAISKIDQGWSPQCYNYPAEEGQWGVLKTGCVNGGVFNPEENKTLPDDIEPPLEIEVNLGDMLMSRASGSTELIGSVALVNERSRARLLLSDKTYRIHLQADIVNPQFFVLLMGSAVLRHQIGAIISGAEGLANNIAQSDIRELLIILPPLDEQCHIAEYAESQTKKLDDLRGETEQTINLLTERRAALITAAITGHLSVEVQT